MMVLMHSPSSANGAFVCGGVALCGLGALCGVVALCRIVCGARTRELRPVRPRAVARCWALDSRRFFDGGPHAGGTADAASGVFVRVCVCVCCVCVCVAPRGHNGPLGRRIRAF